MSRIEIDLKTLDGWNDLPDGSYSATIGAKAKGYTRIIQSSPVIVVKKPEPPEAGNYLTFSSSQPFTLGIDYGYSPGWDGKIIYSTDEVNWATWDGTNTLSSGLDDKLYLAGIGNTTISTSNALWRLTGSNISISGNTETLLDHQTVANGNHPAMASSCFEYIFMNNNAITDISNLVLGSITLSDGCYAGMFEGCENITSLPSTLLPATALAHGCYSLMFYNCTGLTNLPSNLLPATALADNCYYSMFSGCTGLTTLPSGLLPATTLAYSCYYYMFRYCSGLTSLPNEFLPATTLAGECYRGMFGYCSSLTTLPQLPAINLDYACYWTMFRNCTSIKISETQDSEYVNEYRIPYTGTGVDATDATMAMFAGTGGTFTGAPSINATYYTSNEVI